MYKLLVTTALVAITATSASAWTGAKDLISDLDKVYNNLDGGAQFETLQSTGELNTFVNNVATGVTHLSLNVDANNNITASVNEGTSLADIQISANDLVNRVNFDIFVQTDDTGAHENYVAATDYTGLPQNLQIAPVVDAVDPTPGAGDGQYQPTDEYSRVDTNNGLLGTKVNTLVEDVNKINSGLLSTDATQAAVDERNAFVTNYQGATGTINGVDIGTFQTNIDQLNSVGTILGGGTAGINTALNGGVAVDASNLNNFFIPSYNAFNDIGKEATRPGGYNSLSDWANDLQTVVTAGGTGTIEGTGTIVVTDDANGKITLDGVPYTISGNTFVAD